MVSAADRFATTKLELRKKLDVIDKHFHQCLQDPRLYKEATQASADLNNAIDGLIHLTLRRKDNVKVSRRNGKILKALAADLAELDHMKADRQQQYQLYLENAGSELNNGTKMTTPSAVTPLDTKPVTPVVPSAVAPDVPAGSSQPPVDVCTFSCDLSIQPI